jgi:superfamily II DNA or RNA helicase
MKELQRCEWTNQEHQMAGAILRKTDDKKYAVHWLTDTGSTVGGMYCDPERRDLAVTEYRRRCAEALKIREYAERVCDKCSGDCGGCDE